MRTVAVSADSPLVGQSVDTCCERYEGVTVLAHKRRAADRLETRPTGSTLLEAGDLLVAFGPKQALESMEA